MAKIYGNGQLWSPEKNRIVASFGSIGIIETDDSHVIGLARIAGFVVEGQSVQVEENEPIGGTFSIEGRPVAIRRSGRPKKGA